MGYRGPPPKTPQEWFVFFGEELGRIDGKLGDLNTGQEQISKDVAAIGTRVGSLESLRARIIGGGSVVAVLGAAIGWISHGYDLLGGKHP